MNNELRASCANPEYDPEWWFPESELGSGNKPAIVAKTMETVKTAVLAMQICQECPLFKNNSCLEYAMKDPSTIDYGIFASTLPIDRRLALGQAPSAWDKTHVFVQIKQQATRAGVLPVKIAPRERPKVSTFRFVNRQHTAKDSSSDLSEQQ